jgi:hypothetical protein
MPTRLRLVHLRSFHVRALRPFCTMRDRAARIMGKFSVESSAGSGTVVTLTVPGGIIYRTVKT